METRGGLASAIVLTFLFWSGDFAVAEFQNNFQYQPAQPAAPAALPKPKLPRTTARVLPRAFADDTMIRDLSTFPGAPNVHVGVLLKGDQPDEKTEATILKLVNNVCQGLKDIHGLALDGQGGVLYNNQPLQLSFYWYEYNNFQQLVSSGAMKPENQTKLNQMFRENLDETIRRANWKPPTYAELGVPPPTKFSYERFKGEEITTPAPDFTKNLTRLGAMIAGIEKVDAALAAKLKKVHSTSRVLVKKGRNNLEGNSVPTLIYQIIRYTPSAIIIAGDSYEAMDDEYKADSMLFALLMGVLPDDDLRMSKALVFHLDILGLAKQGDIDPTGYEEAKRRYAASRVTRTLIDLGHDFETYTVKLQEYYRLKGIRADRVVAQLRNLKDYLKVDVEEAMAKDYEDLFGERPRDLAADTQEERLARFKFRTWNLMSEWISDPKESNDTLAQRLDTVAHVLDLAMQGRISGPEMDAWVKEKEKIDKQRKDAAAAQPGAPVPAAR